jgi:type IV pilus assembly protein PilB
LDEYIFYTARGCIECNNTGFKGRTAINEILLVNGDIRDALLNRLPTSKLREVARQHGQLISTREDGFYKAIKGITSLEEVLRLASYHDCDALVKYSAEDIVALCGMEYR